MKYPSKKILLALTATASKSGDIFYKKYKKQYPNGKKTKSYFVMRQMRILLKDNKYYQFL